MTIVIRERPVSDELVIKSIPQKPAAKRVLQERIRRRIAVCLRKTINDGNERVITFLSLSPSSVICRATERSTDLSPISIRHTRSHQIFTLIYIYTPIIGRRERKERKNSSIKWVWSTIYRFCLALCKHFIKQTIYADMNINAHNWCDRALPFDCWLMSSGEDEKWIVEFREIKRNRRIIQGRANKCDNVDGRSTRLTMTSIVRIYLDLYICLFIYLSTYISRDRVKCPFISSLVKKKEKKNVFDCCSSSFASRPVRRTGERVRLSDPSEECKFPSCFALDSRSRSVDKPIISPSTNADTLSRQWNGVCQRSAPSGRKSFQRGTMGIENDRRMGNETTSRHSRRFPSVVGIVRRVSPSIVFTIESNLRSSTLFDEVLHRCALDGQRRWRYRHFPKTIAHRRFMFASIVWREWFSIEVRRSSSRFVEESFLF